LPLSGLISSSDEEQDGSVEESTRIDVEAPVEQVWEVLREGRAVAGVGADGDLGATPGRRAARRRSRVRVEQPRIPPTEYVVTELEPSRSFTWVATGPGVRTTARHLLEELSTGRTRVTLAVKQAGPVGVVMGGSTAASLIAT
jgi:hypothetical protein